MNLADYQAKIADGARRRLDDLGRAVPEVKPPRLSTRGPNRRPVGIAEYLQRAIPIARTNAVFRQQLNQALAQYYAVASRVKQAEAEHADSY